MQALRAPRGVKIGHLFSDTMTFVEACIGDPQGRIVLITLLSSM